VRSNAMKHGLCASEVLLASENADAWNEHLEALIDALQPTNYTERLLVERAAISSYRLRRGVRIEQAIFKSGLSSNPFRRDLSPEEATVAGFDVERLDLLGRYEAAAERSFLRILATLHDLRGT
jgi:hypothetical protein